MCLAEARHYSAGGGTYSEKPGTVLACVEHVKADRYTSCENSPIFYKPTDCSRLRFRSVTIFSFIWPRKRARRCPCRSTQTISYVVVDPFCLENHESFFVRIPTSHNPLSYSGKQAYSPLSRSTRTISYAVVDRFSAGTPNLALTT